MIRRDETVGGMIKMIDEALEKKAAHHFGGTGITKSQLMVLLLFLQTPNDTMTLKEVEKSLHCAQSTAHGLITRLEMKGLVVSRGDPQDKRIRVIQITEKGKEYCKDTAQQVMMIEKELLEPLNKREQQQFISYLTRVRDALI